MNKEELLTANEFAVKSRMGVTTVYKHLKTGKIKFVTITVGIQKTKMIPISELKKFNVG